MLQPEQNDHQKSKVHTAKKVLRVDLTPMVDLGFLLITFFILASALSEPGIAKLVMPRESHIFTPVKKSATITFLLMANDSIAWYDGNQPPAKLVHRGRFADLRSVINKKQRQVAAVLGDRKETVVIISPGSGSSYKNLVDVLDEIQINDIQHYFVADGS